MIKKIIFILLMSGLLCTLVYFSSNQLIFLRIVYPIQAYISVLTSKCTQDTPQWVKETLFYIIHKEKILSNQLAFIDSVGHLFTCESGWKGTNVFSDLMDENTRFRYASNTKILTHIAVIQLVKNNKIKLNDPFISYFPELKKLNFKDENIQKITISDLLQHRSGLDRIRSEDVMFATDKTPWCPNQLTELAHIKLDFEPNKRYTYDNRNSCLLGVVIERVSGQSYRSYIENNFSFNKNNIKFIDGDYLADEVKYDFRNSDFWMVDYFNKFDWQALSSTAGVSGSAKALAKEIYSELENPSLNILSISDDAVKTCNLSEFKSCNGYIFWQYQENSQSKKLYFRNGTLPAATSLVVASQNKELLVWLGGGVPLYNKMEDNDFEEFIYRVFNEE